MTNVQECCLKTLSSSSSSSSSAATTSSLILSSTTAEEATTNDRLSRNSSRVRSRSNDRLQSITPDRGQPKRSNRQQCSPILLNMDKFNRRYNSKKVTHNTVSSRLYMAIHQEALKSKPDYFKRITSELNGFHLATIKQLFEVFNIKEQTLSDDLKCEQLVFLFIDGFLREYSLINSHIGSFDDFF